MNYQRIYNQIINQAKNRKLEGYKEKHHIVPKCLGGSNDKENLVELTAREHFLCHRLLCEIYPNNDKLWYALFLMAIGKNRHKVNDLYIMSSRTYEQLRLKFIDTAKKKKISDSQKEKISKSNSKKVIQYDFQGNQIKNYPSAAEAERYVNNKPNEHWKKLKNNIDACCRGDQKSAYGYIWKYEGDILYLNQHIGANKCVNGKKVICTLNNKTFPNQKETLKQLNISNYTFYKMIQNNELKYEN
jgi:hypothetical protein